MSLFGFGDIKFNNQKRDGFGPLSALEGSGDFSRDTFRYPLDVGAFDKGHYMVFYIREQKKSITQPNSNVEFPTQPDEINAGNSTYWNIKTGSQLGNKISSGLNQINSVAGNVSSQLNGLKNGISGIGGSVSNALGSLGARVKSGLGNIFGQSSILTGNQQSTQKTLNTSIKRISDSRFIKTTTLTKEAIALYMPDTLMYNHTQNYDQISMGEGLTGTVFAAGRSFIDKYKSTNGEVIESLKSSLKTGADAAAVQAIQQGVGKLAGEGLGRGLALGLLGQIQNPMLEMVYQSPNFREFQFDFVFYPRDEKEAIEVQNILDRFRYHQAPEFGTNVDTIGATLRPPSEFDIRFYYGSSENPNIPVIAEGCVLKTIDINYAPNGFSAYEVPGENIASLGRTGMPTAIQLTLQFAETSILTKRNLRNPTKDKG